MLDFTTLPYVDDRFKAVRRETVQVRVGDALIGGNAPILVQSMTTTKPKDVLINTIRGHDMSVVICEINT